MDLPGIDLAESNSRAATPEAAFRACEELARSHYENFSVGTRLIPKEVRKHFYSVYAFCRGVDDLGDEAKTGQLALLDEWERQLRLCYDGAPDHIYFKALQVTVEKFDIPQEPFLKLIEANRRDQRIKRHPDYQELLEYCDHSANPVGRIVLYVFGHREPELHALSRLHLYRASAGEFLAGRRERLLDRPGLHTSVGHVRVRRGGGRH